MLSQSPGIYIVLGAVLGSIISGTLLIINTSLNNKFQLEREKQQRIWQGKNEEQKWYREKIYDSYRKSLEILTKIIQAQFERENGGVVISNEYFNTTNLYFKFVSEFSIIRAGHPDKGSEEFQQKIVKINEYAQTKAMIARAMVTEIMENDPRIKNIEQ
jgi:hypothetical protein